MKNHVIDKIWILLSLLTVIYPIYFHFSIEEYMQIYDYIMIGIVSLAQLYIIFIFYKTEPKWSDWILNRAKKFKLDINKEMTSTVKQVFISYNLLIFSIIIPNLLYIDKPMKEGLQYAAFFLAISIWRNTFLSPLYKVFTGVATVKNKVCIIPPISFITALCQMLFRFIPYNLTISTIILASIFCFEVPIFLGTQTYINKKNVE